MADWQVDVPNGVPGDVPDEPNAEGEQVHVRDFERSFVILAPYTNTRSFVKG
jgi:hypothetical protein